MPMELRSVHYHLVGIWNLLLTSFSPSLSPILLYFLLCVVVGYEIAILISLAVACATRTRIPFPNGKGSCLPCQPGTPGVQYGAW